MHHHHLDILKRQPPAAPRLEDQLDDLTGIEVAADELGVVLVFFEGRDAEVVGAHDWDCPSTAAVSQCCRSPFEVWSEGRAGGQGPYGIGQRCALESPARSPHRDP